MAEALPVLHLVRHGETAWSLSGQHTGLTDLPLTERGEQDARRLGERLRGATLRHGAHEPAAARGPDLRAGGLRRRGRGRSRSARMELRRLRGRTSADIHAERPDWELFRDGCPDGEIAGPGRRPRRPRGRSGAGRARATCCIFSSGHILRVLAARWLGLEPRAARYFLLSTASLSALGYEHNRSQPVIRLWDDTSHVGRDDPREVTP